MNLAGNIVTSEEFCESPEFCVHSAKQECKNLKATTQTEYLCCSAVEVKHILFPNLFKSARGFKKLLQIYC